MRTIHAINTIMLPFEKSYIWKHLTNLSRYPQWWPKKLHIAVLQMTPHLLDSHIEIRPYGGVPFYCTFSAMVPFESLTMRYSGIYEGQGVWTLQSVGNQTKLTYEIHLTIRSRWISALAWILPLDAIHRNLMDDVLTGLENELRR